MSRRNPKVKGGMFSGSPSQIKYSEGKMLIIEEKEFQFLEHKSLEYAMEQHYSNIQEGVFLPNTATIQLNTDRYLLEIQNAYRVGFNMCLRCLTEDLQTEIKKQMDLKYFKHGRCIVK